MAAFQIVLAAFFFMLALRFRHRIPGTGNFQVEPAGMVFVMSAMILFGISLALLLRSPFRMALGERMYRLVWLGPLGRLFLRVGGWRAWKKAGVTPITRPATIPPVRATQPPMPAPVVAPDRIAALEQRVSELERWRKDAR